MNSNKKENIAITALTNEINQFDNIEESLKKRDKEPVWDGDLYLYKNDTSKKSDLVGRIPVQVKGTDAKINVKNGTYYDIEIVDIENYKKDHKGAIYFVVEIKEDRTTKIYYKIFDLKTIDDILEKNKENQKTKRFRLEELKPGELDAICISFIKTLHTYEEIKTIPQIEVYKKNTICYDYNTKYEALEIEKSNAVFYETRVYKEAKEKLEEQNIIILHGEPWVGKTSTARKLVSDYMKEGYIFLYGNVDDLVEIKRQVVGMDGKVICLLDDFLGSNVQYLEKNIAESTLDKIVNIFKNATDKKLILTTRTYIYNHAKELFYKFHHATSIKDEYLIDVTNYSYEEKGSIFYNHMQQNNLLGTDKHRKIIEDKFYADVITHANFNPGVIALICERMGEKDIKDIKEYIREALNSPEKLWEEEYRKLTDYEKMVLAIIVFFGVKVPLKYVEEQFHEIIRIEKIQVLDAETFEKAVHVLSNAFIKITFNKEKEKELEVCKHSVADYIIHKVQKNEILIDRYIKSAKYAEVLHYINLISYKDINIEEKLAQKVEKDMKNIKGFFYNTKEILIDILKNRMNPKREKILKKMILDNIYFEGASYILEILEEPKDPLYSFAKDVFKEFVIEGSLDDFAYGIRTVSEFEIFFNQCLNILDYKKNSEVMLMFLSEIEEFLQEVVSRDVEDAIKEISIEYIAEEIIDGKNLKDIIKEYIEATVTDEMPSLKKLYSKKVYQGILDSLYKYCDIEVDEKLLEAEIEIVKANRKAKKKEDRKTILFDNYELVDQEQIDLIEAKFEKGIREKSETKKEKESYYELIRREDRMEAINKWWINSFYVESDSTEFRNLVFYQEFKTKKKKIDDSISGLGKQFIQYMLHERNKVSKEAEELLGKIAYENLKKANYAISKKDIKKYQKEKPKEIQELLTAEIIIQKYGEYVFLNSYIYLFLGVQEIIKYKYNLLECIFEWNKKIEDIEEYLQHYVQKMLQIYAALDTENFNKFYLLIALKAFLNEIEMKYEKIGKRKAAKGMMDFINIILKLDRSFNIESFNITRNIYLPFIEFVTGTDMGWDFQKFDFNVYQEELFAEFYSKKEKCYILDIQEMMKDKIWKKRLEAIGVFDYLYDIYQECKNTVSLLHEDMNINAYGMAENKIRLKYLA